MRKITIFIAFVMLSCLVFGQTALTTAQQLNAYKSTVNTQIDFEQLSQDLENLATKTPDGQIRCFSAEYNEMLRLKYPSIQNTLDFESWIAPKIEEYNNNVINGTVQKVVVNIPVIMHIIHNSTEGIGTGRNISQAQATSQITILNNDYRKLNADTSLIPTPFKPLAADLEINFVPALRYASNHALAGQTLAEPGIERISAPTIPGVANTTTGYSTTFIDNTIKPNTFWNRTEVMNIWVCQISGGILGYAQFPTGSGLPGLTGGATGANTDGLVLLYTATGTGGVAAAPYNKGRTATHEIGHWFGLRHIWGDETACAADDYVTDTPQQKSENYGCPSYPQTTQAGGRCSTGDPSSMFMNYMDYTDDACMFMFTQGQKARVVTVLANSPGRAELPTSTLGSPLATTAQFVGTPTSIPVGNSVTFTDQSISPNTITTWNWTFTGGTPSSFVGQTPPAITYNTPGNYDVSLTVTDDLAGTDSETKVAYINVFTAGACDTLNFPPPGTIVAYTTGAGTGYLVGNNQYGDLAKAEYFSAASHAPYTFVTGGLFAVRSARDGGNGATVDFNVWDATGAGGSPGAVLGTVTVPLATLNTNPTGFENTIMQIMYPNAINVGTADYFFGFTMNGFGTGDTLGVFSNTDGDSSPGTGWEQWSDNSWNTTTASWGINISQYLSPIMSQNAPTAAITTNATSICAGGTVNFDASTSTNAVGYNWIFNSGSPATSTSTAQTVTYAAAGTPRAYLVVDGNCGSIAVDSVDITVNPNNTVSVASSTPTLCINTALTNITHTTTGATGIGAATGLPAGVTANWAGGTITISGTPTASGTFNYVIPLSGGCGTVSATGTITVTPNKTVSAASSSPTVCVNTAITNITHTTTLATGIGAATGLPAGVTANWAGGTITISGTPTASGTFNYSIPLSGGCGTISAIGTITVNPNVTPTFAAVSAICSGDALSPLPTTSTNGITGTWSPALDNTTTTTYTFTPTAGQCATTTTLMITVNPATTPTFAPVSAICSGDALSPLPTTSTNGVNGTWSPALDNMNTTTYTFTPTAGQCATTTTLMITVNSSTTTPTFTAVSAICSGDALSPLPTISNNGITGMWSPALDNTTTTTYTFTPDAGQCATTTTLTITVNSNVTPTFAAVSAICSGDALAALPTTSTNGITGTWSPALDNTTTTTYTFTPTAGQCATTTTLTITVNSNVTPTFAAVSAICSGDALAALPTISNNGITGTWSPALDNTTTTTYTFTPDAGQCASTTTMSITVNPNVTPTFTAVSAICSGDALSPLPTTSTNGINGTWSPALDNMNTTTYTFTPTAGQCATTTTLTIIVNSNVTPTFAAVGPYCSGAVIPALPTTSTNGITGTWSPAINNAPNTTTTYTFTPAVGQCATNTTLMISIYPSLSVLTSANDTICSTTSTTINATPSFGNGGPYTYSWTPNTNISSTTAQNPIVNPSTTTTYYVTLNDGCSSPVQDSVTITVNPSDVASISYPQSTYCITAADATPTITGLTGGTFSSSPAGLTIDGSTGIIGVSSSTDGTYTVSYTTNGTCQIVSNATIVIDLCTGVEEVAHSEIKVYPNPTSEFLTIETANLSVDKISLMNLLGEKLVEQNTHGLAKTTINVNEFAFGIYLLQLYNADGEVIYTQKLSIK
ncbi:MAG: PKD domain-containing protein [Bacteroidetes bacterium]|nr:PKD domain-containing protein [Bacteroidota bacterium]